MVGNHPRTAPRGSQLYVLIAVVAALYFAQDVFVPLALAALLAFVLAPVAHWLERHGVNRVLSVLVSVTLALSVISGLAYVVGNQFLNLMRELPVYKENLRGRIKPLRLPVKTELEATSRTVKELADEIKKPEPDTPVPRVPKVEVVEKPPSPLQTFRQFSGPLLGPLATAGVVLVFLLFMLLERDSLRERVIRLLGADLHRTTQALTEATQRVSRYLTMQLLINCVQGALLAAGLYAIGVPNAVLWGSLLVVLRFIPYLGPWIAAFFPVALAFAVFEDWTHPLLTVALVTALEILSNQVLEPLLYGHQTGVSPLALLVAAVFWTWLWGGPGLVLAIPLTVTLAVIGKHVPQLGFFSVLLGNQPVLEPRERFYQRLLAGVPEDADEVLDEALRNGSLHQALDDIVFPALAMMQRDHYRGALDEAQRLDILAHVDGAIEDLFQSRDAAPAGRPAVGGAAHPVICVPAYDESDEIGAAAFARLLSLGGIEARALPLVPSRQALLELLAQERPACLCICGFPPPGLARGRQLCRRLHERLPAVPLVAALWSLPTVPEKVERGFAAAGASAVFTRVSEGCAVVAREARPLPRESENAPQPA